MARFFRALLVLLSVSGCPSPREEGGGGDAGLDAADAGAPGCTEQLPAPTRAWTAVPFAPSLAVNSMSAAMVGTTPLLFIYDQDDRAHLYRHDGCGWADVAPALGPSEWFTDVVALETGGWLAVSVRWRATSGLPVRLWRSADQGRSWAELAFELPVPDGGLGVDSQLPRLQVTPRGVLMFSGGEAGWRVFRSRDEGAHWALVDSLAAGPGPTWGGAAHTAFVTAAGSVLLGGHLWEKKSSTSWVFLRAAAGADDFTEVQRWQAAPTASQTVFSFSQCCQGTLFAFGTAGEQSSGVLTSSDDGRTWTEAGLHQGSYAEAGAAGADGSLYLCSLKGGLFRAPAAGQPFALDNAAPARCERLLTSADGTLWAFGSDGDGGVSVWRRSP